VEVVNAYLAQGAWNVIWFYKINSYKLCYLQ
jgi:hypothetical protein